MRKPTNDKLALASMWLDCNEADGKEKQAMQDVSNWLKSIVEKSQFEAIERQKGRKLTEEEKTYLRSMG